MLCILISVVLLYFHPTFYLSKIPQFRFNFTHKNPKPYNVRQNLLINQEIPEIYKKRQKHVQDMCEEYHDQLVANYKLYSPLQSFESVVAKAEVLHSTNKVPFLWCKIPKVASQSWNDLFVHTW